MSNKLFVYGSLRKGFESPAYDYMSAYFDFEAHARVRGRLYDLGTYPAAKPTDEETYIVGELYTIRHEDELGWALGQLDDYEGVHPEEGEQQLYYRALAPVQSEDGEWHIAYVYWYAPEVVDAPIVTSGDILDYLRGRQQG